MSDGPNQASSLLAAKARENGEPVEWTDETGRYLVHGDGRMVPAPDAGKSLLVPGDAFGSALPMQERQWDNFDQSAQQNWFLESKAKGSEVEDGSSLIDQVIEVRWFLIHEVEFSPDEHGEISSAYRTVLITPEFRCIQFVSDGVLKSMNIAIRRMGKKTFDPALKVVVKQITTRSKRKMLVLDPVFED